MQCMSFYSTPKKSLNLIIRKQYLFKMVRTASKSLLFEKKKVKKKHSIYPKMQ